MYHVISIGITAVILYFLSYILYHNGFYSRSLHRKIWNFALAAAFLLAALAGLFLALQVNYKWNIPFIKTILKWHVECGIGLAFTGIFHFIWHLSYFTIKAENARVVETVTGKVERTERQNAVNLFIIGFVSTSAQMLLMREIMNISGGYELITGTFFASWLTGSAAGSYAARSSLVSNLKKLNIAFGLALLISLLLMLFMDRLYLNPGETPSFLISIVLTLIVLLPFTFISGFSFMKIMIISGEKHKIHSGSSFSYETAGGIVSGILISLVCFAFFDTYQVYIVLLILFFCYFLVSFLFPEKNVRMAISIIVLAMIILVLSLNPDRLFRGFLLPGIKVTYSKDTPYGNITSGRYSGEESIYYNHRLIRWQNDEIEREENVHYAMLQHDSPGKVLVISGDIASVLHEIMKYQVSRVVYVERDPALLKMHSENRLIDTQKLEKITRDAYSFLRKTEERYDVILLIIPPPSTLLLNRYYTTDFFSEVKKKLGTGGVFMCSPGAGENYFNRESTVLYSSVFNSLKSVFGNVEPIVGNKLYFIASDRMLTTSICSLVEKKGIQNTYVNSDFLSDDLIKRKSAEFISTVNSKTDLNTLAKPTACFHFQTYSLSRSAPDTVPSVLLIVAIFFLPLFWVRRKNIVMCTSAGALAGFEMVILITLQSSAGNMYQLTGLIIAGLMAGLALGTGFKGVIFKKYSLQLYSAFLLVFYAFMALFINSLLRAVPSVTELAVIIALTLIPSFFTGQIFRFLTTSSDPSSSTAVYIADLGGSSFAFIAVSALSIPLLGIRNSLFLLAAIIFAGFLFGTIGNKS